MNVFVHTYLQLLKESKLRPPWKDFVYYHSSASGKILPGVGIHIGTKLAATQALESRIGIPVQGEWDGTRQYGETLCAGQKMLKKLEKTRGYYLNTGHNIYVPEDDYYPKDLPSTLLPKFSTGEGVRLEDRPTIYQVKIIGNMTNTPATPHTDAVANGLIRRQLKLGRLKSGYFYQNEGEDVGSISAVVPSIEWLEILN